MTSPCVGDHGEAVGTAEGACCIAASGAVASCTMAAALTFGCTQLFYDDYCQLGRDQQREVIRCSAAKQLSHNGKE